jgi:hypothetical protein
MDVSYEYNSWNTMNMTEYVEQQPMHAALVLTLFGTYVHVYYVRTFVVPIGTYIHVYLWLVRRYVRTYVRSTGVPGR